MNVPPIAYDPSLARRPLFALPTISRGNILSLPLLTGSVSVFLGRGIITEVLSLSLLGVKRKNFLGQFIKNTLHMDLGGRYIDDILIF